MSHQLPTWVCATFIAVSSLVSTPTSVADSPHVQFDVVPTSVALDITDETFQQLNPDERLIETRLQISALMQRGAARRRDGVLLSIRGPRWNWPNCRLLAQDDDGQ